MGAPRSYRSKLEVLRDFLRAAREPAPKTRIIGAANLNPVSFRRYLRLCTQRDLIMAVSGGYVATPRATPLLEAIDRLMLKTSELESALHLLGPAAPDGPGVDAGPPARLRLVLREAWNEIALEPVARSGGRAGPAFLAPYGPPDAGTTPRAGSPPRSAVEAAAAAARRGPTKIAGPPSRERPTAATSRSSR